VTVKKNAKQGAISNQFAAARTEAGGRVGAWIGQELKKHNLGETKSARKESRQSTVEKRSLEQERNMHCWEYQRQILKDDRATGGDEGKGRVCRRIRIKEQRWLDRGVTTSEGPGRSARTYDSRFRFAAWVLEIVPGSVVSRRLD